MAHNLHQGDAQIYPDMPAYHSIAVTLGRAGLLKELIKIIEYMRQKPSKRVMTMRRKDWDPSLEPDVLVYNSVRIPSCHFLFFFLPNSLFSVIFFLKYVCLVPWCCRCLMPVFYHSNGKGYFGCSSKWELVVYHQQEQPLGWPWK